MHSCTAKPTKLATTISKINNLSSANNLKTMYSMHDNQTLTDVNICDCCGKIVNKEDIPFLTDMDEVKLGIGVRLYFMTLLFNLAIFIVGFLFYSLCEVIHNMRISRKI